MKLPLITTNMPGCKEVVRDGWNGLLVPPRNAEALAIAVLQLLKSDEQRVLMGNRSGLHVTDNFTLAQVADAYTNIYHSIHRGRDVRLSDEVRFQTHMQI